LSDAEWSELRRRLGEEERLLDEMFGFVLEARAEGVAAIDPSGTLAQRRFPSGGTLGHAALLLIAKLHEQAAASFDWEDIVRGVGELAEAHRRRWAGDLVDAPERLARQVTELLVDMRLAAWAPAAGAGEVTANAHADAPLARAARSKNAVFSLLPAAARFLPSRADDTDDDAGTRQESLW
jgi:hypothetical protein